MIRLREAFIPKSPFSLNWECLWLPPFLLQLSRESLYEDWLLSPAYLPSGWVQGRFILLVAHQSYHLLPFPQSGPAEPLGALKLVTVSPGQAPPYSLAHKTPRAPRGLSPLSLAISSSEEPRLLMDRMVWSAASWTIRGQVCG